MFQKTRVTVVRFVLVTVYITGADLLFQKTRVIVVRFVLLPVYITAVRFTVPENWSICSEVRDARCLYHGGTIYCSRKLE